MASINIITKPASETQGLLVSLIAGEDDRAIATLRYGGQGGNNLNWRLYGKYFDRAANASEGSFASAPKGRGDADLARRVRETLNGGPALPAA